MTSSIRASDSQFLYSLPFRAIPTFGSVVLLNYWSPLNLRGCTIAGLCAEVSAIVARFVTRFFTDNAKILRGIAPIARFVGGHYFGNMALTALRFHPITFGASAAIMLPSLLFQMLMKFSEETPESRRIERDALL